MAADYVLLLGQNAIPKIRNQVTDVRMFLKTHTPCIHKCKQRPLTERSKHLPIAGESKYTQESNTHSSSSDSPRQEACPSAYLTINSISSSKISTSISFLLSVPVLLVPVPVLGSVDAGAEAGIDGSVPVGVEGVGGSVVVEEVGIDVSDAVVELAAEVGAESDAGIGETVMVTRVVGVEAGSETMVLEFAGVMAVDALPVGAKEAGLTAETTELDAVIATKEELATGAEPAAPAGPTTLVVTSPLST